MRHIKTFSLFESVQILTPDQKDFLDKHTKGTWSLNPSTGLVDVDGNFDCSREGLKDFLGVRFGAVSGDFYCDGNNLKSLEGAPQTVGGNFNCSNNLTSLAGAPETVGGNFDCGSNNLTSLAGAPETVGGNFDCDNNNLTSLEGAPQTVVEDFWCQRNNLTSLEGAPKTVRNFYCSENNLTSLEGAPETVGEDFSCRKNNLKSLEGAPETVGGYFSSDGLSIPEGKWSIDTLIKIFLGGTAKRQQLLEPLVGHKVLQQRIDQNPEGMLVKWKDHLKNPHLQGLKWPQNLDQEKDLLSDLADIGL